MFPYSLNYNFNTKYNYYIPSSISNKSNQNYYPKDTDKRNYKKRSRKSPDLNFKHIFLIMNNQNLFFILFIYINPQSPFLNSNNLCKIKFINKKIFKKIE